MKRPRGRPPKDDVVADVESALMTLIHRSKPDSVEDVAAEIARERQRAIASGTEPRKAIRTRSIRTIRKRLQNFRRNERANREVILRAKIEAFREKYKRNKGLR